MLSGVTSRPPAAPSDVTDPFQSQSPIELCLRVLRVDPLTKEPIGDEARSVKAAIKTALGQTGTLPETMAIILKNAFEGGNHGGSYVEVLNELISELQTKDEHYVLPVDERVEEILLQSSIDFNSLSAKTTNRIDMSKSKSPGYYPFQQSTKQKIATATEFPPAIIALIDKELQFVFPKEFPVDADGQIQFNDQSRQALIKALTADRLKKDASPDEVCNLKRVIIEQAVARGETRFLNGLFDTIRHSGIIIENDVDLSCVDLSGLDLRSVDFFGLILRDANLAGANLQGVYLCGATIAGANFSNANLIGANLSGKSTERVNFRHAILIDANLEKVTINNANFSYANLTRANLKFANLRSANLKTATLIAAQMDGANMASADFRYADMSGANMCGMTLLHASMDSVNAIGTHFEGSAMQNVSMVDANISDAVMGMSQRRDGQRFKTYAAATNLRQANMTGVIADGTKFQDAILVEANLTEAVVTRATLHGADLRWATLINTNLTGTSVPKSAKFESATIDECTMKTLSDSSRANVESQLGISVVPAVGSQPLQPESAPPKVRDKDCSIM